ncbi:CPBP family intramembrane metalloprotease, partial [Endobacter medicaginis]
MREPTGPTAPDLRAFACAPVEGRYRWRRWLALAILVGALVSAFPVETLVYHPFARWTGLQMISGGMMNPVAYAALMVWRLVWNGLLVLAICAALGRTPTAAPIGDRHAVRAVLIGVLTGVVVMAAAICAIIVTGAASATLAPQRPGAALAYGTGWMLFDLVGATGEEFCGRVALLLVAERFVGWRGAILVSGLLFAALHLANPGVSVVWLLRIAVQGMLLAYATYRTRSVWWAVGYHTGWNWASAPLFGAAGSGYLDRGHLLDFTPTGPVWLTGGAVGPEGSVFAFVAMAAALGSLL